MVKHGHRLSRFCQRADARDVHQRIAAGLSTTILPIFISHASEDKGFVEQVIKQIPQSHLFYDVNTIDIGNENLDAIDDGLLDASVFVLFVSPNSKQSDWVKYEAAVARFQKIKRQNLIVIAVPIKGATYRDAPEWMRAYMAATEKYRVSDIARLIKFSFEASLRNQGLIRSEIFIGRESQLTDIVTDVRTRPVETGVAVNFIVLAGIQNMGRTALARHLVPKIFPGSRTDGPIIDLSRNADAFDLFVALRNEAENGVNEGRFRELEQEWPSEEPKKMAEILLANLQHYADVNQTIVIRSARGLRGAGFPLKEWIRWLLEMLAVNPDVRVIWISEGLIHPNSVAPHKNVLQFSVKELDHNSIFVILTELLGPRSSSVNLKGIAERLNGHPGTAHYVARLIGVGQRSPESLQINPHFIVAYQQRFLEELLDSKLLSELELEVLKLLSLLPSADFDILQDTLSDDYDVKDIRETLDILTDDCLVTYSMNLGYKIPDIVRSVFLLKNPDLALGRLERLAELMADRLHDEKYSVVTAEAIVFANVILKGEIPGAFRNVVTGSMLHELVYQQFTLGQRMLRVDKDWRKHFEIASKLARLAEVIPMTPESCETVMFYGADAMIRMGGDPAKFVADMEKRGFKSADYIKGSFLYYRHRDRKRASEFLWKAFRSRKYVTRTARLLAKVLTESNEPQKALQIFDDLGDRSVYADSGLLSQKIKCLKAAGRGSEATALMETLRGLNDEYGEYEMITAAQLFREGEHARALEATDRARKKPKVNLMNLTLLEASILIESGKPVQLEEVCKLAVATGRADDAHNLRARAALKANNWKEAEAQLSLIQHPNYYDSVLQIRMLNLKLKAPEIIADPTLASKILEKRDQLIVQTKSTIADLDRYDLSDDEVSEPEAA